MPPAPEPRPSSFLAGIEMLTALVADHHRMRLYYRSFRRRLVSGDLAGAEAVVDAAINLLSTHGRIERELLYPAARRALAASTLISEFEREADKVEDLLNAVCFVGPDDEGYIARVEQMCLTAMRHALDEEARLFPLLVTAPVAWEALAAEVRRCRAAPAGEGGDAPQDHLT